MRNPVKFALAPLFIAVVSVAHKLRGANRTLAAISTGNGTLAVAAASPHPAHHASTDPNGPKPDWVDNPLAEYFFSYTEGPKIWKWHHYFHVYHKHLARYQAMVQKDPNFQINMLVIGVQSGGEVGMWRDYFGDRLSFTGIDINPACKQIEKWHNNTFINTGDQGDVAFLRSVVSKAPKPHIIIDDGSHVNAHQILTFETYWPYLDKNGVYIVEDTTTSYSDPSGYHRSVSTAGLPAATGPAETLVQHMKARVDYVNGYWANPADADKLPFVKQVDSIAFYDGMVVVEKRPHPHPQQEQRGTETIPYCTPGQANGCKR